MHNQEREKKETKKKILSYPISIFIYCRAHHHHIQTKKKIQANTKKMSSLCHFFSHIYV
jgi:hypothetical protein